MRFCFKVFYTDGQGFCWAQDPYKTIKARSKEKAMQKFKKKYPELTPLYVI